MKVICRGILQGREKKKPKKLTSGFVVVQKTAQSEDLQRHVRSKAVGESAKGKMSHVGMSLMEKKLENCLKEARVVQMRA